MSNKAAKPFVVLDFVCDLCGKKIDHVVIARDGTQRRIAKTFHRNCWELQQSKTGDN